VRETEHFVNDGYGWACKRCLEAHAPADELSSRAPADPLSSRAPADSSTGAHALPRFFCEGESEERETSLSAGALARWTDDSRRTLLCPRCGVEEEIGG
jgi:hypothetical protein